MSFANKLNVITSHYVMVTNKLYNDRTDDHIILCKFGSHTISGYRVAGVGPSKPPLPVPGSSKKPDRNMIKLKGEMFLSRSFSKQLKQLSLLE